MTRRLSPLLAIALVAACSEPRTPQAASGPAPSVQAAEASCRPSQPGRRMTLCAVTLTSTTDDALIAIESPRAARAALQDTPIENGMVVVTPRSGPLALPAGRPVRLTSGGTSITLQGVAEPVLAGQTIPLTLTFNAAPPVEIVAAVAAEPAA